jgi:hypothetical protein
MRLTGMIVVALAVGSAARAQEPSFEALGQAPVIGGDRVRARERALDEALRQAVEQATATVLDPAELVARAAELKLRVYPKARTYVVNYRVLDEGDAPAVAGQPSNLFQVHLSAQVSTARLTRELTTTATAPVRPTEKPRAVVCVRAQGSSTTVAEKVVRELLASRLVETVPVAGACADDAAVQAARAGAAQGAVVGAVEIAAAGPIRGTRLEAAHARGELRLLELDGKVAASGAAERDAYESSAARAEDAAAAAVVSEAARALAPSVASKWAGAAPSGGVIVRLHGVQRWADYTLVLRALGAIPGVAAVEPRRFVRGEADLLVRTATGAAQLLGPLARLLPGDGRMVAKALPDGALTVDVATPVVPPEGG